MSIEFRIFLAILGGFFLGEGFIMWLILWPLTGKECLYLRSFYEALREGEYDVKNEEGANDDAD